MFDRQAAQICAERTLFVEALGQLPNVHVFPTEANFVLIRLPDSEQIFNKLLEKRILVKNVGKMHALLANCLRITISTPQENQQVLAALRALLTC